MGETSHKSLESLNAANVEGLLVKVLDGRAVLGPAVAVAAGTSFPCEYEVKLIRQLRQCIHCLRITLISRGRWLMSLLLCKYLLRLLGIRWQSRRRVKGKERRIRQVRMTGIYRCCSSFSFAVCHSTPHELRWSIGVLRNVVDSGSEVDEQINIVAITNEVALPIINDLLNLDTTHTVARVFELVREIVCHFYPFPWPC